MTAPSFAARLDALVTAGTLSERLQVMGRALSTRLKSKIQLMLLGPDDALKAAVLTHLANRRIETLPGGGTRLSYHSEPTAVHLAPDGRSRTVNALDADTTLGSVHLHAPQEVLRWIEIIVPALPDWENSGVYPDIFAASDICLWCSSNFSPKEQVIWGRADMSLKDHSFLVTWRGTGVSVNCGPDFRAHFRLGPITLLERQVSDMIASILRVAKAGRAADEDNALLFLNAHEGQVRVKPPIAKEPVAAPPQPASAALAPEELPPPVQQRCVRSADALYVRALGLITDTAREIASRTDGQEASDIMSFCAETSEALAGLFEDADYDCPAFLQLRQDILSSADTLVLMSLEGAQAPMEEAVGTLVQLKQEIAGQLAA